MKFVMGSHVDYLIRAAARLVGCVERADGG
jgi:hypothetical protein